MSYTNDCEGWHLCAVVVVFLLLVVYCLLSTCSTSAITREMV